MNACGSSLCPEAGVFGLDSESATGPARTRDCPSACDVTAAGLTGMRLLSGLVWCKGADGEGELS
jgi:hypothetical protein